MKISIYHLLLVFTFIQTAALAQINTRITPMHKFMQANADSSSTPLTIMKKIALAGLAGLQLTTYQNCFNRISK